jgi:hypothetical protein
MRPVARLQTSRRNVLQGLAATICGAASPTFLGACRPRGDDLAGLPISPSQPAMISAVAVVDTVLGLYTVSASQAPRGVNRSTYAVKGELATKDHTQIRPGAMTDVVIVRGSARPGDGGGGTFVWDSSGAPATDDGGTVIIPNRAEVGSGTGFSASAGCWRRVLSWPIQARWFGPAGGPIAGKTVDDTCALQSAIDVACNIEHELLVSGDPEGAAFASMALDLGYGEYTISRALTVSPLVGTVGASDNNFNVFSESRAVLRQITTTENIIQFSDGGPGVAYVSNVGNRFRGITFVGGRSHLSFRSNNQSVPCLLHVEDCEFHASTDFAVAVQWTGPGQGHLSALVAVDHCRFLGCAAAVLTNADETTVADCWVQTPNAPVGGRLAVFCILEGTLNLRGMVGVGAFDNTKYEGRWIDNHGSVFVSQSRFGGDTAAGMPVVYHFTPLNASLANLQGRVVIRDSIVAAGSSKSPTTAVVYIKNDDVANASACPSLVVLDALTGPFSPALVVAASADNLETLLKGGGPADRGFIPIGGTMRSQIRISVDPNLLRLGSNGIDKSLLPFLATPIPAASGTP